MVVGTVVMVAMVAMMVVMMVVVRKVVKEGKWGSNPKRRSLENTAPAWYSPT